MQLPGDSKHPDLDVLILGATRWDFSLASSTFSIAQSFSKHNRVFYIERPFTWKDVIKHWNEPWFQYRKRGLLKGEITYKKFDLPDNQMISITPPLLLPINFLPEGNWYNALAKINQRILTQTVEKIIHDYGVKKYIYLNSFYPYYLRRIPETVLQPKCSIYRSVDDISQEKYIARHGVRGELEAVQSFDIVTASSQELCNRLNVGGRKTYRIPNAVDFDLFHSAAQSLPVPRRLQQDTRQRVLFSGYLNTLRSDIALLITCLKRFPNVLFVVVGPYDQKDFKKYQLDTYSNLLFEGNKSSSELPPYLSNCDVGIIPFLKNKLTNSIYPLKVNEYLAAGMPVVTTHFSKELDEFKDLIYTAENHEQFIEQLGYALQDKREDMREKRMQKALENTWDKRVEQLWELMEPYLSSLD